MPKWHEVFDILKGPLSIEVLGILIVILFFMFPWYWKFVSVFQPVFGELLSRIIVIMLIPLSLFISCGYMGAKYYNKGSSTEAGYALAIFLLTPVLIFLIWLLIFYQERPFRILFFIIKVLSLLFIELVPLVIAVAIGYLLARFAKLSISLPDYEIVGVFFIIFVVIVASGIFLPEPLRAPYNSLSLLSDSITSIYQKEYGMRLEKDIILNGGSTISAGELVRGISLPSSDLHFYCADTGDDALCAEGYNCGKPLCVTRNENGTQDLLIVNKNVKVNIVICINTDNKFYYVIFARHALNASRVCAENIDSGNKKIS